MDEVKVTDHVSVSAFMLTGKETLEALVTLPAEMTENIKGWIDICREMAELTEQDVINALVKACLVYAEQNSITF